MKTFAEKMKARREALALGKSVTSEAIAAKRDLTADERKALDGALDTLKSLDADAEFQRELLQVRQDEALFKSITAPAAPSDGPKFLSFKTSPAALRNALGAAAGRRIDSKALISGVTTLPVGTDAGPIVPEGRPAASLLAVIPAQEVETPPYYGFLQQGPRTNNAAPVAVGGTKPTSPMSLTRKQGRLRVVAHLSEPVDRFLLEDFENLYQFVSDELGLGVRDALIGQILNGDGLGENILGLANLSGVQVQAFNTDAVTSVRSAFTTLETMGHVPTAVVMSAAAWAAIETSRTTSNGFILSPDGPVDPVARRLYGVPVVVVPQLAGNVAWVLSEGSLVIKHDKYGIRVDWGVVGDSFAKNEIVGRAEGRFDLAALRPAGIVQVALAAA